MTLIKKIGGRPKALKLKEKWINSRFTIEEYEMLTEKAKVLNLKKSQLTRLLILNGTVSNVYTDEEVKARNELVALGNNLNQIAKEAHTFGLDSIKNTTKIAIDEILLILRVYKDACKKR